MIYLQLLIVGVIFLLVFITIQIAFLFSLRNVLKNVSEENRTLSPNKVWLLLIPFFNYYYFYYFITNLHDSVQAEFAYHNQAFPVALNRLKRDGLIYWLCICSSFIITLINMSMTKLGLDVHMITRVLQIVSIFNLVYFILFWVRVSKINGILRIINRQMEISKD